MLYKDYQKSVKFDFEFLLVKSFCFGKSKSHKGKKYAS